jgi:hypothetical protein
MRLAGKIAAVLVAGTLLGFFATWITVYHGDMPGGVNDGPWRTNLAIGSARSDPYTRASVALHGLLALNHSETIYYTATHDSDGNALDGRCSYEVAGRDPDARWWSITAYGADDYLIPNPANRYSVSKTSIVRGPNGVYSVEVGQKPAASNWIAVAAQPFSLTLRLYNPGPEVVVDPVHAALPVIRKGACT